MAMNTLQRMLKTPPSSRTPEPDPDELLKNFGSLLTQLYSVLHKATRIPDDQLFRYTDVRTLTYVQSQLYYLLEDNAAVEEHRNDDHVETQDDSAQESAGEETEDDEELLVATKRRRLDTIEELEEDGNGYGEGEQEEDGDMNRLPTPTASDCMTPTTIPAIVGEVHSGRAYRRVNSQSVDAASCSNDSRPRSKQVNGRGQWGRIIHLSSEAVATQNQVVIDLVARVHGDAAGFLNSHGATHRILPFPEGQSGNIFTTRYVWTMSKVKEKQGIQMYILFGYLFWYDFVRLLHPEGTGRVGTRLLDKIKAIVGTIQDDSTLKLDEVADRAKAWSIRGRKVNQLCERFGAGIVFFLYNELSDDFLDNKYTASGSSFDDAMERLELLGLEHAIRSSGADELAAQVRAYMIEPLRGVTTQMPRARRRR